MRIYLPLAVYVVAFAIGHTATKAENKRDGLTNIAPASPTTRASVTAAQFNGFQVWRAIPDSGAPRSAGFGFQHFSLPMHRYNTWYRPRAATLTQCRRCEKNDFRPRGFGNLFATPVDCFRMEYSPYVLSADNSQYGPSYIARQPDQRCDYEKHGTLFDDCDHWPGNSNDSAERAF